MTDWTPHPYQVNCVRFMLANPAAGLFLDPGLGKTSTSYAAFSILREKGIVRRMLVIAPLRPAHLVWPVEAQKWADFADLKVVVLHGPKKNELLTSDADVFVINPEGLPWLEERFRKWQNAPEMLVVDESTKFKHSRTQRFKLLKKMLSRFKRRYILTGTPAPNGLLDLFGQVYILDLGEALGAFISHYRNNFFVPTGYGGYTWVPRDGADEEIQEKLEPLVVRLSAEDYLDLPEKVTTVIGVDLPPKAAKEYARLKQDLVLRLKDGEVTAPNAGALTAKLRQAANGAVYADEIDGDAPLKAGAFRPTVHLHDAKIDALRDLVDELSGQPVLIAYEFQHDVRRIQEALKGLYGGDASAVPYMGGGVTTRRAREIEGAWNRGELPALPVHPASAAHGLNLQAGGHHLIWFGLTYNLEYHDQLIDRIYRQGQDETVFVYYLIAKRTMDATVLNVLRGKAHTQKALLDALKEDLSEDG
jgi:SNF2 family DNA or RNA helicase